MKRRWLGGVAMTLALAATRCTSEARIGSDTIDAGSSPDAAGGLDASAPVEGGSDGGATVDAETVPSVVGRRYGVLLRGGENQCAFSSWEVGGVSSAEVVFSEDAGLRATIQGLAAAIFSLIVGTNELIGEVDGPNLTLRAVGAVRGEIEGCAYTIDATVRATIAGDRLLDGTLDYTRNLGGVAACAVHACTTRSTFIGLRAGDP